VTNCIGTPKNRVNFGATWDFNDAFRLSTVVNWRDSIRNTAEDVAITQAADPNCASHFADGSNAPNDCELKSFYTIDLSGSWKPTEALEIFGSVNNVTDRIAPLDPLTYGAINYNPMDFSGAIGRYYTLGVKYSFK